MQFLRAKVRVQAICQNKLRERVLLYHQLKFRLSARTNCRKEFYCVIGRSSGSLPEQVAREGFIVPLVKQLEQLIAISVKREARFTSEIFQLVLPYDQCAVGRELCLILQLPRSCLPCQTSSHSPNI
jgi:hypothetical protein